jgi:hypothetical protein
MATVSNKQYDESGIDFPESWIWDEHGDRVSGTFVRFTRGQTKAYGARTIVVLAVDGVERSIWLSQTVLYNKFRDELRDRTDHSLEPGEAITIRRKGKVESPDAMGAYWAFDVIFHDKPPLETGDLFPDLDEEPTRTTEPKPAKTESSQDDGGIPF